MAKRTQAERDGERLKHLTYVTVLQLMVLAATGGHFFRALGFVRHPQPYREFILQMLTAMPKEQKEGDVDAAVRLYTNLYPSIVDLAILSRHIQNRSLGGGMCCWNDRIQELVFRMTDEAGIKREEFGARCSRLAQAETQDLVRDSGGWPAETCYKYLWTGSPEMRLAAIQRARLILWSFGVRLPWTIAT